jgi:hypothetical protein
MGIADGEAKLRWNNSNIGSLLLDAHSTLASDAVVD